MIDEFLSSWSLFRDAYLSGWALALLLGTIGVVVVLRDQIFLGAALSQSSTLGIALALVAGERLGADLPWIESEAFPVLCAVLFAVGASLLVSALAARRESHEAVTGWVFLAGSSASVIVVKESAHGVEEVHHLLFSSLIGADEWSAGTSIACAAITLVGVAFAARPLILHSIDPAMAAASGLRTRRWSIAVAVWLGVAIGIAIKVSGLLYTFGFLVLPALAAKSACREILPMLIVSPLLALATSAVGFVLAHRFDLPPAQVSVLLASIALAVVWAIAAWRGR
jgi:ABC-type Mn2+/Zn2+ transport system permease subunit